MSNSRIPPLRALARMTARERYLVMRSDLKSMLQLCDEITPRRFGHWALDVAALDYLPSDIMGQIVADTSQLFRRPDTKVFARYDRRGSAARCSMHARAQCLRAGDPLWVLDEQCASALVATEPPMTIVTDAHLQGALRLPYQGLYMQLPRGLFSVTDYESGVHDAEGLYLCQDMILNPRLATPDGSIFFGKLPPEYGSTRSVSPALLIGLVGRAKGVWSDPMGEAADMINDTTITYRVKDGDDLTTLEGLDMGGREGIAIAINFLMALNSGYLQPREVPQQRGPKSRHKRRKALARGEVFEAHTHVSLGRRAARAATRGGVPRGPIRKAVIVRGHWRTYWVRDLAGRPSLGIRKNKQGTTLHRVARWTHPFVRGAQYGTPSTPTYHVTKGTR